MYLDNDEMSFHLIYMFSTSIVLKFFKCIFRIKTSETLLTLKTFTLSTISSDLTARNPTVRLLNFFLTVKTQRVTNVKFQGENDTEKETRGIKVL